MPGTITCARPSRSSTSGVAQVSISSRRLPPDLLAGLRVEHDDERSRRVIPHDDQAIAVQRWRAALAELLAHPLVAEIVLPQRRAVHVVGVEAARFERRDQNLAVR